MSTATWSKDKVVSHSTEGRLKFTTISGSFGDYTTQYFDKNISEFTAAQLTAKGALNDTSLFKRNT